MGFEVSKEGNFSIRLKITVTACYIVGKHCCEKQRWSLCLRRSTKFSEQPILTIKLTQTKTRNATNGIKY